MAFSADVLIFINRLSHAAMAGHRRWITIDITMRFKLTTNISITNILSAKGWLLFINFSIKEGVSDSTKLMHPHKVDLLDLML